MIRTSTKLLGIPFPSVPVIFVGGCGNKQKEPHGYLNEEWIYYKMGIAHTHLCVDDPIRGAICTAKKQFLRKPDGSASEVLWHEYAHILDIGKFDNSPCTGEHNSSMTEQAAIEKMQDIGHSPSWEKIMGQLGLTPTRTMTLIEGINIEKDFDSPPLPLGLLI